MELRAERVAPPESGRWVRRFTDLSLADTAIAGGKGANLGELLRAKLPVPEGFVITAESYLAAIDDAGLRALLRETASSLHEGDPKAQAEASALLRARFSAVAIPDAVRRAIYEAYAALGSDVRVAVRSSATSEDSADASFAGMNETYTNVRSADALLARVVDCWASLWSPRVLAYRASRGMRDEPAIAVVVQAPEYGQEMWRQRLREGRDEDRRTGRLDFGPHADRIRIAYQEREIRHSGSRGQQKLASVALKLAECAIRRHYRQIVPVLLLDDCLEALDPQRQERLLQRLGQFPGQVLMTAPVDVHIPAGLDVCVQRLDADGIRPAGQSDGSSERISKLNVGEAA